VRSHHETGSRSPHGKVSLRLLYTPEFAIRDFFSCVPLPVERRGRDRGPRALLESSFLPPISSTVGTAVDLRLSPPLPTRPPRERAFGFFFLAPFADRRRLSRQKIFSRSPFAAREFRSLFECASLFRVLFFSLVFDRTHKNQPRTLSVQIPFPLADLRSLVETRQAERISFFLQPRHLDLFGPNTVLRPFWSCPFSTSVQLSCFTLPFVVLPPRRVAMSFADLFLFCPSRPPNPGRASACRFAFSLNLGDLALPSFFQCPIICARLPCTSSLNCSGFLGVVFGGWGFGQRRTRWSEGIIAPRLSSMVAKWTPTW